MTQETVQLRMYVTKDARKKLKIILASQEMTIADLLRNSVEEYLRNRGIEIDLSEGIDSWGGPGRKGRDGDEDE